MLDERIGVRPVDRNIGVTSYENVNDDIIESLRAYMWTGRPTGGFLRAVLENDLKQTVMRADHENIHAIPAIVAIMYNELPAQAQGNAERVDMWIQRGGVNGMNSYVSTPESP